MVSRSTRDPVLKKQGKQYLRNDNLGCSPHTGIHTCTPTHSPTYTCAGMHARTCAHTHTHHSRGKSRHVMDGGIWEISAPSICFFCCKPKTVVSEQSSTNLKPEHPLKHSGLLSYLHYVCHTYYTYAHRSPSSVTLFHRFYRT